MQRKKPKGISKRGGKRLGAGKPKGALTYRNREAVQNWIAKGVKLPIDVMMENMLFWYSNAEAVTRNLNELSAKITASDLQRRNSKYKLLIDLLEKLNEYRDKAESCAVDAASYFHPRLAAIQHQAKTMHEVLVKISSEMTPKEAAAVYQETMRQIGYIDADDVIDADVVEVNGAVH
jgi:hypothetical protein